MSHAAAFKMNSHDKYEKIQREYWSEHCPFGDYMILADEYLKSLIGRGTTQSELDYLADLQECDFTPREAAWIIVKESFYRPWK